MYEKHGKRYSTEYTSWRGMKDRCSNPANTHYSRYGGRGITVCERWNSFSNFFADMGNKPTPAHTIDRKNPDGHYEPDNCVWATRRAQSRNKASTITATINGHKKSLSEWCEIFDRDYNIVKTRIVKMKWHPEAALSTPTNRTYSEYLHTKKRHVV